MSKPEKGVNVGTKRSSLVHEIERAVFGKIDGSPDEGEICRIVEIEVCSAISCAGAVVAIRTSGQRTYYYAYHESSGFELYEPDGVSSPPEYLRKVIDCCGERRVFDPGHESCPILAAPLYPDDSGAGYLALVFDTPANAGGDTVQALQSVAVMVGQLLDKRNASDAAERREKCRLIEKVLALVIHDMRNPLSGISGFVQLIEQKTADASVKRYCAVILESLAGLGGVMNDLQMVICGKQFSLAMERVSVPEIVAAVINDLREVYEHAGVRFEVVSTVDGVLCTGDANKLSLVFKSIIKNAREAMPGGGLIRVTAAVAGGRIEVEIADTGAGMPARIQERVFEPFVSFGKEHNIGMGMTIAKTIIQQHQGTITVTSGLGKGSVVTVSLPCA